MPRLYTSCRFGNFFWEAGNERLAPVHPGAEASGGQGWACFLSPSLPLSPYVSSAGLQKLIARPDKSSDNKIRAPGQKVLQGCRRD